MIDKIPTLDDVTIKRDGRIILNSSPDKVRIGYVRKNDAGYWCCIVDGSLTHHCKTQKAAAQNLINEAIAKSKQLQVGMQVSLVSSKSLLYGFQPDRTITKIDWGGCRVTLAPLRQGDYEIYVSPLICIPAMEGVSND